MKISELRKLEKDALMGKLKTSKEELVNTLGIEPNVVEEILTMLKKGFEEAEVENDEETDDLLAELEESGKSENKESNEVSSEMKTADETPTEKSEEIFHIGIRKKCSVNEIFRAAFITLHKINHFKEFHAVIQG